MSVWLALLFFCCIIFQNVLSNELSSCKFQLNIVNCANTGLKSLENVKFPSGSTQIRLQGNQLTKLPVNAFDQLQKLEYLDLNNNNLTNLPIELFNSIPHLKVLKLRKNKLTKIPLALDSLLTLEKLDLRHNKIKNLGEYDFQMLANFEQVDIGKNLVDNWPQIDQLLNDETRLKLLNLADNQLPILYADQFAQFNNLRTLKLAKNRIKLVELGAFEGLGKLQTLDLNRNLLVVLPTLVFGSLNALETLNLARNHLSIIQPGAFHGADNLRSLNLSSNRLDFSLMADGGLYGLKSLEELDLTNNKLDRLPTQLYNHVPKLKRLWLKANNLKTLTADKFFLPELEFLSLVSNQLDSIQPGIFNGLSSLIELDLSDNNLANIIEDKSSLRNLSLPHIQRLNFATNNLKVLRANAFAQFPELAYLDLRQNPISTLEPGSFDGISLQHLFMDTRSLHCDCNLKWFVEWLRKSGIDLENVQVVCQTPAKLRGKKLLEIRVENLICGAESPPLVHSVIHPQPLAKHLVGATALFKCSGYGLGPLDLEWKLFKDGNSVKLEDKKNKYSLFINHTKNEDGNGNEHVYGELEISNLGMENAGDYQCSIQNAHSTVYLDPVQLVVQQKPVLRLKPKDVVAMQGTNVLLECAADGEPAPMIRWDKDQRQEFPAAVERRLYLKESEDGVYLLNVSKKDEGLYTCHATSDAGHAWYSAYVQVFDEAFKNRLESAVLQPNGAVSLNCAPNLTEQFELKWFWNETIPINETELKFAVTDQTLTVFWTDNLTNGVINCELYVSNQLLARQTVDISIGSEATKTKSSLERSATQATPTKRQLKNNMLLILIGLFVGILLGTSIGFCVVTINCICKRSRKAELSSNESEQPLNKDTL